jgi:hypothetical protein
MAIYAVPHPHRVSPRRVPIGPESGRTRSTYVAVFRLTVIVHLEFVCSPAPLGCWLHCFLDKRPQLDRIQARIGLSRLSANPPSNGR